LVIRGVVFPSPMEEACEVPNRVAQKREKVSREQTECVVRSESRQL